MFFQLEGRAEASCNDLVDHKVPFASFCAPALRAESIDANTGAVYLPTCGVYCMTYCCSGSELSIRAGVVVAEEVACTVSL